MAKFSGKTTTKTSNRAKKTPVKITGNSTTFEGGVAFSRDAKSDLFFLAINNMVGEGTFYEGASDRDERFRNLVRQVALEDPKWLEEFIPFLRQKMFMRSASLVAAAEYAYAGAPNARQVINSALQRPDEPAEFLGYWVNDRGYTGIERLPYRVKRGLADAARRMYNEKNALKYDGLSRGWRPADVINLTHPKPVSAWQNDLFKYLLDRRFDRPLTISAETLPVISAWLELQEVPQAERRHVLKTPERLTDAGLTWEMLSGYLGGPMDAEAWEAIIPSMGYMALLRNLRNFDEAGISKEMTAYVQIKLSDPEEVARSKQFPYRFYNTFKHTSSVRWAEALEAALELSTKNIPSLGGTTLVCVDTSASMGMGISGKSKLFTYEVAALFGVSLAKKGEDVTYVEFASTSGQEPIRKSDSVLRAVEATRNRNGKYGHGTNMWEAVRRHYSGHDRVVIITDMQTFGGYRNTPVSLKVPIYGFNLSGYGPTALDPTKNQYEFGGGLSDATFTMLSLLESVGHTGWPWKR